MFFSHLEIFADLQWYNRLCVSLGQMQVDAVLGIKQKEESNLVISLYRLPLFLLKGRFALYAKSYQWPVQDFEVHMK